MFGSKYLLLELDKQEAEFYHLPDLVPYLGSDQKKLNKDGFSWELSIKAMRSLVIEDDCDEYKLYKLFVRKWPLYEDLNKANAESNYEEAEKIIDKILSIDLLDPSAYLNLGFVFRAQKEFYKSEQAYLKGLDLVSNRTVFLTGLAKTYEEAGKTEDAIYTWNQIFTETKNIESLEKLMKFKVYDKDENPGSNFERLMRKEFQKSYNDVEALTELGIKLVHHKMTDLAVKVFERVYMLSPGSTALEAHSV